MEAQQVGSAGKVSSKDVAREAGVSQATVSYVLNDVPGVKISPDTREAVLAAAKKLNYHPNQCARGMRLKKAMSVAIVSDRDISSLRFMRVLEGIEAVLAQRNYSLTLCFDKWHESHEAQHVRYYRANRVDGAVFVFANTSDEHYAYLTEHRIPFVVIQSHLATDLPNIVKSNLDTAILAALTDLRQKGVSSIGFLGRASCTEADRRFGGYVRALRRLGLYESQESLLIPVSGDTDRDLVTTLDEYCGKHARLPRAILCETARMGFCLLRYAARMGIRVPSELAVVAIGSSSYAELSFPALSTIEGPLYDMGATGIRMLFDIIEGRSPQTPVVLDWSYMPRESS